MLKSKPTLVQALAVSVIEALQTEGAATIPGLGTFRREHRPARVDRQGGTARFLPPEESVVFVAHDEQSPHDHE